MDGPHDKLPSGGGPTQRPPDRCAARARGQWRWRQSWFRIGAVLLGLAPFALFELVLAALDWGRPTCQVDPFVGFRAVRPLFVPNPITGRYEIPRSRQTFFRPDGFAVTKAPTEFRIFCLGGSTVQGRPYAIETSFTTWLEIGLRAAAPQRQWEVINCGGVSYASYRLVPILEEVLGYHPDLIVLYTGHNEFLENRAYQHIVSPPLLVTRIQEALLRSRSYSLLCSGYYALRNRAADEQLRRRPILESEVQALLDYRGGLETYQRDDRWRQAVIDHFRYNLRRLVQLAERAGVPVVLVNPISNIRDCPPFKVQHRANLTLAERQRWQSLCAAAHDCYRINKFQAIDLYRQATVIDDQHAGVYYNLAKCYDDVGRFRAAHEAYLKAKELDVCPLRMLEPMHAAVWDVARQTGAPVVDVRKLFELISRDGIPGRDWLIDHVHPTVLGHRRIADALLEKLVALGQVRPRPDWQARRARMVRDHLAGLDREYDAEAMVRLRRLQRWTQGRARRLRPPARTTDARPSVGRADRDPAVAESG